MFQPSVPDCIFTPNLTLRVEGRDVENGWKFMFGTDRKTIPNLHQWFIVANDHSVVYSFGLFFYDVL